MQSLSLNTKLEAFDIASESIKTYLLYHPSVEFASASNVIVNFSVGTATVIVVSFVMVLEDEEKNLEKLGKNLLVCQDILTDQTHDQEQREADNLQHYSDN